VEHRSLEQLEVVPNAAECDTSVDSEGVPAKLCALVGPDSNSCFKEMELYLVHDPELDTASPSSFGIAPTSSYCGAAQVGQRGTWNLKQGA
jgi:hypothetical protein